MGRKLIVRVTSIRSEYDHVSCVKQEDYNGLHFYYVSRGSCITHSHLKNSEALLSHFTRALSSVSSGVSLSEAANRVFKDRLTPETTNTGTCPAVRGQTLKEKKRLGHRDRSGLVEEAGVYKTTLKGPDMALYFPYVGRGGEEEEGEQDFEEP
ncbi:hypothetical protein E1301_Tti009660 [Triplophysa tibetana]|uniref:Uncharacterized protein n=1 Tax=Triplophysa tibetana TaxID=1572043 RepID=A0A5A9NCZ4_9TELE|nr:hypothetical protein E1301_Tti009660 [Triplophysa tibetana]